VVSRNFQFALGLSFEQVAQPSPPGGGGFRWQIKKNDRWKLKIMLPEPHIEYKARDDLHLFVGVIFAGIRIVSPHDFWNTAR